MSLPESLVLPVRLYALTFSSDGSPTQTVEVSAAMPHGCVLSVVVPVLVVGPAPEGGRQHVGGVGAVAVNLHLVLGLVCEGQS